MYRGRFAPSPTGALHAGSLVAALASWLDARAHAGVWLVRMEDIDTLRCVAGADPRILAQLAACGLIPDEPVVYQSQRTALYQSALDDLIAKQAAYPCACSRRDIEDVWAARGLARPRHGELVYPGTCRHGLPKGRSVDTTPCAWRSSVAGEDRAGGGGDIVLPHQAFADQEGRHADALKPGEVRRRKDAAFADHQAVAVVGRATERAWLGDRIGAEEMALDALHLVVGEVSERTEWRFELEQVVTALLEDAHRAAFLGEHIGRGRTAT